MGFSTDNGSTMGFGSHDHQPLETPRLCFGGCGFFGTAENRGLCSKCYTHYRKEHMSRSTAGISEEEKVSDEPSIDVLKSSTDITESGYPVLRKSRCALCKKKVGLLGFECRCGVTFCGAHRYPEEHLCRFDFMSAGKTLIEKENPICKADKIVYRA